MGHLSYLHSFIMPMSTQRLSRHAWQWRLLSLVMVQLPLKGHVKAALRFILRLNKLYTFYSLLKYQTSVYKNTKVQFKEVTDVFKNFVKALCVCLNVFVTVLIIKLCEINMNLTNIALWYL